MFPVTLTLPLMLFSVSTCVCTSVWWVQPHPLRALFLLGQAGGVQEISVCVSVCVIHRRGGIRQNFVLFQNVCVGRRETA